MAILETTLEEQARRRAAVEHARSEARLEGLAIAPAFEPLFELYERGELSDDELVERLKTAPLK